MILKDHRRRDPGGRGHLCLEESYLCQGLLGHLPWEDGHVQSQQAREKSPVVGAQGKRPGIKPLTTVQYNSLSSPTLVSWRSHRTTPLAWWKTLKKSQQPPRYKGRWECRQPWSSSGLGQDKHSLPSCPQLAL